MSLAAGTRIGPYEITAQLGAGGNYVNAATGALMVATVTPGDPPTFSAHRQVNPGPLDWGWNSNHSFDIDHRSGRFIIAELVATNDLTVLTNWQALIRKQEAGR